MQFQCPKCQSVIYSRKEKTCGRCGEILPPEILLTSEQIQDMDEQRKSEKKRSNDFDLGGPSDGGYL
jgi:hypothetical protein